MDAPGRYTIVVPTELRSYFRSRRVNGHGGFQSLGRLLAEQLESSAVLQLTPEELKRIVHYARAYGEGGFQNKLKILVVEFVHQNWGKLVP